MMAEIFEGRCQCGEVSYRLTGEPINFFACHCKECQKQSASAFGLALWVTNFTFEKLDGDIASWTRTTPSGQAMIGEFCKHCGTRLFHRQSNNPQVISIKPGTLENLSRFEPVGHIWTSEKQTWVEIPGGCLTYSENPPDFKAMLDTWQQRQKNTT